MNILFLTSRVPYPPHRGDKLRTWNFLRVLAQHHTISVLSFSEGGAEDREAVNALRALGVHMTLIPLPKWRSWLQTALFYILPFPSQVSFYFSLRMLRAVQKISHTHQPDIAYIHLFRMFPYRHALPERTYIVLDLTDVISKELFRSLPYQNQIVRRLLEREAYRIRAYEKFSCGHADETWVISESDKNDLQAAGGEGEIHVIANGLPLRTLSRERHPEEHLILFYGYTPVHHNKDAFTFLTEQILPHVRVKDPRVRLLIVGAGGKRRTSQQFSDLPIEDLGFVEQPDVAFQRAALLVAPLRFVAGVQNKLLEAMASGVPVITSPLGNEGIGGTPGEHLEICRTADEFVLAIVQHLHNPKGREEMGKRGKMFIERSFSWDGVVRRFERLAGNIQSEPPHVSPVQHFSKSV